MNTIQINNVLTQIDVSKYVKGALSEQPAEQKENVEIQTQLPSKGTKQYDELKATLSNIKVPLTDENLKTANIMIKSGIEVQKENMETVAEIRKQVDYIINHINDNSVESAKNNNLSLDKITLNILENLIKETNLTESGVKTITKSEVKQNVDTYLKENKIDSKDNKSEDLSKYVEKLLYNGLPITYKNISQMELALEKGKKLSDISIDDIINLLKKDKDTTIDEIYISKYSSNKKDKAVRSFVNEKEFEALIPQIKNIVNNKDIDKALKASKILLENEIPVTYENISKLITTDSLKNTGIDEDKLLEKAAQNIKDNKLVIDINLTEIVKSHTESSIKTLKLQSKTSELNDSKIQHIDYDNEKKQYKQLIKNIPKYDDEVIKKALESNNIITLKNLDLAYNEFKDFDETSKDKTISELTDEQKGNLKSNLQKELDIITVKRQLAEIQLRLTSEASSLLIKKGIEIDTMPLKDAISELKKLENELYKSQLNLVGTQPTEDNIGQMEDLFDRLSNITELSTKTYKDIVYNEIPFTINGISDAEEINSRAESLQLQEASKTYESLQTQPNPKFNESFNKIANQIKPILEDLNIEPTDENIRAAEILIKNQIELNDENIIDIKLVDSKVNKVTTQLHPIIAANMIKDGLKPAEMKIDEVIDYMNKFKELLGEDLTQKISSYIYEMDKTGDMTKDERETMIGIYRMLYTIDKTKGRATGFIVKNEMDLTLNNLMEASKYYDKTYAKYSDIDVKVDDKFGTLEKLIIDDKSIKAQLNKAYTSENLSNANIANETTEAEKALIIENKNLTWSNQNSIEKLIQKLTPEDLVKISKDYRDFENIQISKALDFINKSEDSNKENNKPLSEMNINQILEFINTYDGLSLKTKDNILKIHNAIKTSTINFENLDNIINTKKELTFNDIITSTSKFSQNLAIEDNNTKTLNEFIKKVTPQNIEKLILKFKDISSVDIKTLLDNINNSAENKNNISEKPIIQMNIDQISNYVENSKNLNYQHKDILLDLYNSFNTIYNNENKVLSKLINSAEEVTINTLRESVNNFKNQNEALKNDISTLMHHITPATASKLVETNPNISNIPIKQLANLASELQHSNELRNVPKSEILTTPLTSLSFDEVVESAKSLQLNEEAKDSILKLYDNLKTLNFNSNYIDKLELQPETETLNSVLENLKSNTHNHVTELINNITPAIASKVIEANPSINDIPIKQLANLVSELQHSNELRNVPKSEILTTPLASLSFDEVVESAKTLQLNEEAKDSILKLYDNLKALNFNSDYIDKFELQPETEALNSVLEKLNSNTHNHVTELTNNITPAIASKVMEANPNITNIPIKQLADLVSELQHSNELRNTPKSETLTTPLTSLSFDEVVESAKTLQLNEEAKDSILKLYDNLKSLDFNSNYIDKLELQPETETLNSVLENLKSNTHNHVTELINNITPAIASKVIEANPSINDIPIKQLANLVSELQHSNELRNVPKSETLTTPLTSLSFDEVIESAKSLQVNEEAKDSILKLYDNLKSLDFNSNYIDKLELQPETETLNSVLENLKSNTHNHVTELINNITPTIASKVIETNPNINDIPIKQLANLVSELQHSNELRNVPKSETLTTPLASLSFDEVVESAKTLQLNEEAKDSILKLYDNLKALNFNSDYIDKLELQPETETLNSVLENLKSNTYNRVTELINNITPAIASKVVEANPNITNIPIKQLANLVSELQHSNELRNVPKSETLTTPLISLSFDEVIESAKALQLNEETTNTILKLYTVFEDIKTFKSNTQIENLSINDLINSYSQTKDNQVNIRNILDEFAQKVTPEAIIKLNKKYTDIDSIPLKTLLDDINITGNSNNQRLSITKLNNKIKISSMTIEDVINCVNTNYLIDNKSKDSILKIHSIISSLNSEKYNLLKSISDADNVTLNNVLESINQQENLKISNTIQTLESKFKLSEIQTQAENLINELADIDTQTVNTLLEAYPNLNEMSVNKVLNLIKNTNKNGRLSGIDKNSDFNNELPNIDHILDTLNNLKSNKIDKHQLTENLIQYTDEIDQKIEFSLESLIEETDNLMNTNVEINADSKLNTVFYNNIETPNVLNKSIDLKQNIIDEFIEKADPEIISKLLNQSYDIENLPLERILEAIDSIQKFNNPKEYNNKDLNKENKEFIQRLSKLSNVEPATILWMKNNNIPLSIQNIEVIHNFVNNPFWFGQQINNLSKEFKSKLSNDKTLEKIINKKNFNDLKKGKSFDDILNELEDEIHEIKKDIIQLPNQERQNLWKQSSDLEKAIEIQKQIQKDEMIYQIPIQLHSGITNMNLYVMNDKEGNGKLSDNNMKIFLAMNTETLGNVQIYMNFTEKNVSFQINSDTPEATKFLKEQQLSLQMSIEDLGYIVNKMQYGEDKPKSAYKLDIRSQITGINTSKLGFEAIM